MYLLKKEGARIHEKKKKMKNVTEFSGGISYYGEAGGIEPRVMKEAVSTPAQVTHRDQEW